MLLLPLQPLFAADAEFAHLLQPEGSKQKTLLHMIEHVEHIAHHHDGHGDSHKDNSTKSSLHLLDCEQSCNMSVVLNAKVIFGINLAASIEPDFRPLAYINPPTSPPLKPPFVAL